MICPTGCVEKNICTTHEVTNIEKEKPYSFWQKETYTEYDTCTHQIIGSYPVYHISQPYDILIVAMIWGLLFVALMTRIKNAFQSKKDI